MKKCFTTDCNRQVEDQYLYCSIECACYDGAYSVKTGWLLSKEEMEEKRTLQGVVK